MGTGSKNELIRPAKRATLPGAMADKHISRHRSRSVALVAGVLLAGVLALLLAVSVPGTSTIPIPSTAPWAATIEYDRFSALWERSPDGERLHVFLRLRTKTAAELPCFVFVVARNDHTKPKAWAVWPPQPPGSAVTYGGHFIGKNPEKGHSLTLTASWERISAVLPHPTGQAVYDTVLVYVVSETGKVFLARPFRL